MAFWRGLYLVWWLVQVGCNARARETRRRQTATCTARRASKYATASELLFQSACKAPSGERGSPGNTHPRVIAIRMQGRARIGCAAA